MRLKQSNLAGKQFGALVVISYAGRHYLGKQKRHFWNCVCECGTKKSIEEYQLLSGAVISCGCVRRKKIIEASTKHNQTKTRLYAVWSNMLRRCEKENDLNYKHYGARGISVCEEWHDFMNFSKWAYQTGYNPNAKRSECTIDRIDNDGNYEPSNCKWSNSDEQHANRRNTIRITYNGETHTLKEWSEITGISVPALYQRHRAGKDPKSILETVYKRRRTYQQ